MRSPRLALGCTLPASGLLFVLLIPFSNGFLSTSTHFFNCAQKSRSGLATAPWEPPASAELLIANDKIDRAQCPPISVRHRAASTAVSMGSKKTPQPRSPTNPNIGAYISLLRPQNIPASFGLVAAGALVSSHGAAALMDPKVMLTALAAALVAVGSCVLNDWFDLELDRQNKPDRPLVTGEVTPPRALVMGVGCLLGALFSAAAVHPAALQATIATSVVLTMAYTPVLKPLPVIKTIVVALVIAAAIAAGGLASGAGAMATVAPSLLTFFVIAHREIIMDISDVEGDSAAGIITLPVLLGKPGALSVAVGLLTAGVGGIVLHVLAIGVSSVLEASGAGASASTLLPVELMDVAAISALADGLLREGGEGAMVLARPLITAALALVFASPLYLNAWRVVQSGFRDAELQVAVDGALPPLALMLGLLGVALQ